MRVIELMVSRRGWVTRAEEPVLGGLDEAVG